MTVKFETAHVQCEYCGGSKVIQMPSLAQDGALTYSPAECPGCDDTGRMEIRKSANRDWSSKCLTCDGKGFNDAWDSRNEEHYTVDCIDCDATGGITYPHSVSAASTL